MTPWRTHTISEYLNLSICLKRKKYENINLTYGGEKTNRRFLSDMFSIKHQHRHSNFEETDILTLRYLNIQRHALIFTGRKKNGW